MKKLILPILLLLTFSVASAQSFSVSKNAATHNIFANSATLDDTVLVTNLTANQLTLQWEKVVVSTPGAWTTWVCDDVICHPPSKTTDQWNIAGSGHSDISIHINPSTFDGPGEVQLVLTDVNNPSFTETITFTIDAAVGIDEHMIDPLLVYPNPVTKDLLFLDWEDQNYTELSVEVMNSAGQMVKSEDIEAGAHFGMINVGDLPKGFYFARIYADNEVLIRKFVKQ